MKSSIIILGTFTQFIYYDNLATFEGKLVSTIQNRRFILKSR